MKDQSKVTQDDFLNPKEIAANAQKIQSYLEQGRTLQEALDISQALLEKKYALANEIFAEKTYRDAIRIFQYLAVIAPYDNRYWLSLGCSYTLAADFDVALDCFHLATLVDPVDSIPLELSEACLKAQSLAGEDGIAFRRELHSKVDQIMLGLKVRTKKKELFEPENEQELRGDIQERAEAAKGTPAHQEFCRTFTERYDGDIIAFSFDFLGQLVKG